MGSVSVFEFDRLGAGSEREQLMSETDSEDGFIVDVEESAKIGDSSGTVGWISRAIGQENSIILVCDFLNRVVVRVDSDTSPSSNETSNDILFDSAIDESNIQIRVASLDMEWMFRADLLYKIDFARIEERFIFVCVIFFSDNDTSETGSSFTEKGNNSTCVDAGDGRDARTRTPSRKGLDCSPVRVFGCIVGNDDACALDIGGFEVSEEIIFITFVYRGNTIVSKKRLGEDEDLTFIGWIGHGLWIPDNGSGEDCLTADVSIGTE